MQYTATGFSKPIRMIFSNILPRHARDRDLRGDLAVLPPQITYELKTESVFLKYLYEPVYALHCQERPRCSGGSRPGTSSTYLAYIFITLVLLLLFAR